MTTPSGADAAGERNRAAVEQLEQQVMVPVRAAVYAVLADLLDELDTTGQVSPAVDALAARARASWRGAVGQVVTWIRDTFARLLTRATDNALPDRTPGGGPGPEPAAGPDLAPSLSPATVEDRVADLLDDVVTRLNSVPDTMAAQVATALRAGYDAGDTPDELRQRVAAVLGRDEWDPEVVRIARTTTTTVYNAAHTAAANELERTLGRPLQRMWIATLSDNRTRPTHREAHAQVIESGARFTVGDARLRFPGDPLGPSEEIVNCRCVAVAVVDDMVVDLARRITGPEREVLDMDDTTPTDTPAGPLAAADRQVTDSVIDEYSDDYRVDADAVPGITAEMLDAAEVRDGVPYWPVDPAEWPHADADALAALSRIPPQLRRYWLHEEGAGEIRWGTEGSYRRCLRHLAEYVSPGQLNGLCANLYHSATGRWPGERKGAAADAGGPCGCDEMTDAEHDVVAKFRAENVDRLAAALDVPRWLLDPSPRPPVPSMTAATLDDARQGAMIALVPAAEDAARLAVDGDAAIPADDLHVTLLFLGDGADWEGRAEGEQLAAIVEAVARQVPPLTGFLWQVGVTASDQPVPMYLVGDDTGRLAGLRGVIESAAGELIPPQHSPFVAHISTRYGDASTDGMDQGATEVRFDRLRVSYGPGGTDYPLSGAPVDQDDDETESEVIEEDDEMPDTPTATPAAAAAAAAVVARDGGEFLAVTAPPTTTTAPAPGGQVARVNLAAAVNAEAVIADAVRNAPEHPPAEWLRPVEVDGPTPPTVTAEGRVWGHIGQSVSADGEPRCHVGITDECVPIPPTRTNYGAFHRDELRTAEGDMVAVGHLYTGCGHSDLGMELDEAREYLDAACTRTASGRVYDTRWGPMFVGALRPGVTAADVGRLRLLSGEWFSAPLELHAAVGVEAAGFPVDGAGDMVAVSDVAPPVVAAGGDTPCPCAGEQAPTETDPADGADTGDGAETGPGDPAADSPHEPVHAVAAIDQARARRAHRTTDTAVIAAAHRRARRTLGQYQKRG